MRGGIAGKTGQPIEIETALDNIRRAIEKPLQSSSLSGPHKPQMPGRQHQRLTAGNGAEKRHIDSLKRPLDHRPMPRAADIVGDHARNRHIPPKPREALHECGDRLGLPGTIDHQHDRQAKHRGQIGGTPASVRCAIEQPHRGLYDQQAIPIGQCVY